MPSPFLEQETALSLAVSEALSLVPPVGLSGIVVTVHVPPTRSTAGRFRHPRVQPRPDAHPECGWICKASPSMVVRAGHRDGPGKVEFCYPGAHISSPSVRDGLVYFGSDDTFVYASDTDNGKERWRFRTVLGLPRWLSVCY